MGLLELASNDSFWRGYDYFKDSKVKNVKELSDDNYAGIVEGSGGNSYQVTIDVPHPKRSTCNCPHAEGTRRICKHKVALYLTVFPEEVDRVFKELEEWESQEEERREKEKEDIKKYVYSLSKQELREALLWRLIDEYDEKEDW